MNAQKDTMYLKTIARMFALSMFAVSLYAATTEQQQPSVDLVTPVKEKSGADEQRSKTDIFKTEQVKEELVHEYVAHLLAAISDFDQTVLATPEKLAEKLTTAEAKLIKEAKMKAGKKALGGLLVWPAEAIPKKPTKLKMLKKACAQISSNVQAMRRKLQDHFAQKTASLENLEKLELELRVFKRKFHEALQQELPVKDDALTLQTTCDDAELNKDKDIFDKWVQDKLQRRTPAGTKDVTKEKISLVENGPEFPYHEAALRMRLHILQELSRHENTEIIATIEDYGLRRAQKLTKQAFPYVESFRLALRGHPSYAANVFLATVGTVYGCAAWMYGGFMTPLKIAAGFVLGATKEIATGAAITAGQDVAHIVRNATVAGVKATGETVRIKAKEFAQIPSEWDGVEGVLPGGVLIRKLTKKHTTEKNFVPNEACQLIISTFLLMMQQLQSNNVHQFSNTEKAWIFYGEPGAGKTASVDYVLNTIYENTGGSALIVDLSNEVTSLNEDTINSVIATAEKYKTPIIVNIGEALAHSGASAQEKVGSENAREAYNRLLNGTEALYHASVPVIVLATHNKAQCPADLIRLQRMKVIYVGNPDWDERRAFFKQSCKDQLSWHSVSEADIDYFATFTEGTSRTQLGAISHVVHNLQNKNLIDFNRDIIQALIIDTLHKPSDKDDQRLSSGTAAHRAGQLLLHIQSLSEEDVKRGLCAGFASALVFAQKKEGDTISQQETHGLVHFATHPRLKKHENSITRAQQLMAGAEAQKLLVKPEFYDQALIQEDSKKAYNECEQMASASRPGATTKETLAPHTNALYNETGKGTKQTLSTKENIELLREIQQHLMQTGFITVEQAFALRAQLNGPSEKDKDKAKEEQAKKKKAQEAQQKQAPKTTPKAAQVAAAAQLARKAQGSTPAAAAA